MAWIFVKFFGLGLGKLMESLSRSQSRRLWFRIHHCCPYEKVLTLKTAIDTTKTEPPSVLNMFSQVIQIYIIASYS